jgi:hypothetical protein
MRSPRLDHRIRSKATANTQQTSALRRCARPCYNRGGAWSSESHNGGGACFALKAACRGHNAALRPSRGKRATPLALPILDMRTRQAPVLTPSVCEGHANLDANDALIVEVDLTWATATSKRSRSPTLRSSVKSSSRQEARDSERRRHQA